MYPYDPLTIIWDCKTRVGDATVRSIIYNLPMLSKWELFDEDFINAGICDYGGETM